MSLAADGSGAAAPLAGIRVMIAEDEAVVREALADLIGLQGSLDLVGQAADAGEAIALARNFHPDVALVDVKMPGGGEAAARGIREHSPQTRVVALSAYNDRDSVLRMLRAGAVGYLVKGTGAGEILQTIERAARGEGALSTEVTAEVIGELASHLQKQQQDSELLRARRTQIREAVDGDFMSMVYQPIVDLQTREVAGVEALARFTHEPPRTPDVWFGQAAAVGLLLDLELAAVRRAVEALTALPSARYLAVNLSPESAATKDFRDLASQSAPSRLVVEVTEHAAVDDYERVSAGLAGIREMGVRLAIDDAGAGFASLRHILRLAPDIIKLDMSLTRNIDTDRPRRALAAALISFAQEIEASIVAEGIETAAELEALSGLGVQFGQGYHLGYPGALPAGNGKPTTAPPPQPV